MPLCILTSILVKSCFSLKILNNWVFQPQSLSKYEEMARRKENKEKRKSKNVLTEFNSDEIPGHKFEDVDTVLQVSNSFGYPFQYNVAIL